MTEKYDLGIRAGMLLLAEGIARHETDPDRRQRMRVALDRLWAKLREGYPAETAGLRLPEEAAKLLPELPDRSGALRFLIDLAFANPFTPYEHKVFPNPRWFGVERVARELPVLVATVDAEVQALRKACDEASSCHKAVPWGQVALGAGAVVALAMFPLAGLLGSGLAGAAAITYMLALLGGGSVAAGGLGMAGGIWVLVGGSALAGGTPAQVLKSLGSAGATIELMKLHASFKTIRLGSVPPDYPGAFQDIQILAERIEDFRGLLADEQPANVKGAQRVKDMEDTLEAMERALKCMKKDAVAR